MTIDDAINFIVGSLQKSRDQFAHNSYDVYTENVINRFVIDVEKIPRDGRGYTFRDRCIELSPSFFSALWELSRRGVLRPGLTKAEEGGVGNNVFGAGFSFTPQGEMWLQNADYEAVATVIPARFVELLSKHQQRFGAGYLSRGAEAVRCYTAHAFLAACAMCGAAAESILLAIASERKPEKDVLAMYARSGGRADVEKFVIGQQNAHVRDTFRGFMVLLKYWRDEAAHGRATEIGETEAFTSLMLLLRLARFADETFERTGGRLV